MPGPPPEPPAAAATPLERVAAAAPVMVQATVRRHDSRTDSGSVLLDDGQELPYDGAAFARSGLRFLRSGQRVRAWRAQDRITALTLVTLPLPPA